MQGMKNDEARYNAHGCKDRNDYLNNLANDRGIDIMAVNILSNMLGENEDFDGLITALDDYKDYKEVFTAGLF